jgi:hypothetical protein
MPRRFAVFKYALRSAPRDSRTRPYPAPGGLPAECPDTSTVQLVFSARFMSDNPLSHSEVQKIVSAYCAALAASGEVIRVASKLPYLKARIKQSPRFG